MHSSGGATGAAAEVILVRLLDTLLSAMAADTSKAVEGWAGEVIASCMEELSSLPSTLLDCVLGRLLEKKTAPRAYILAASVIRRLAEKVGEPVALLVRAVLERREKKGGKERRSGAAAASSGSSSAFEVGEGEEGVEEDGEGEGEEGGGEQQQQ